MKEHTIAISRDALNLDKTFSCGQTFLWNKMPDGSWIGCIKEMPVILKQVDDELFIKGDITIADIEEYFDLYTDYTFYSDDLTEYEKKCIKAGKGIRILRQPPIDTLVQFVISQNNSMTRIKYSVNRLCEAYGKEYIVEGLCIHSFPALATYDGECWHSVLSEEDWHELGVGYRAPILVKLFDTYKHTHAIMTEAGFAETLDARLNTLQQLDGVGPKVSSCIVLFAGIYHDLEAFPIDTHMRKLIAREYDGQLDPSKFGDLAGLMQQYMFYYEACKK